MKLYFLRHADAVAGDDDGARELSPLGRKQSRALAEFLRNAEIGFDAAYSSPLVRAGQTAEIVLKHTRSVPSRDLQVTDVLLNETSKSAFDQWLKRLPVAKHILLVGHAPSLSEHIGRLLGARHSQTFELSKGALTCLKTEDRQTASLKFSVTPAVLGVS